MINNKFVELESNVPAYQKAVQFPYWSKAEGKSFGAPYLFFDAPSSNQRNWFASVWISSPIADIPSFTNNGGNSNTGMFHTGQSHLDASNPAGYSCHRYWTTENNKKIGTQNYAWGGQKTAYYDSVNQSDERQWWLTGSSAEAASASVQHIHVNGKYLGTQTYNDVNQLTTNVTGYKKAIGTFRMGGSEYPAQSYYGKMDAYFLCRREYITDMGLFSQYGVTSDKNTWQNPFFETDGDIIFISDERKKAIVDELNARKSDCPWTVFVYMRNKGNDDYQPTLAGGIPLTWGQQTDGSTAYNLGLSTIPYAYIS